MTVQFRDLTPELRSIMREFVEATISMCAESADLIEREQINISGPDALRALANELRKGLMGCS